MSTEEKLKRFEDAFNVFERNMQSVDKFTLIGKSRELRMSLREYRPLARWMESVRPLRKLLREAYNIGLPMVLDFAVTCYETFLKELYMILKGEELTRNESEVFFNPVKAGELFRDKIGSNPLKGADELLKDTRIVIIKRNVIIHRNGKIDKRAEDELRTLGISRYKKGQKLELDADEVKNGAQTLKCYATKIFESVISYLSLSTS